MIKMPADLPPEIQVHQNRISMEMRELFKSVLKGKFSAETAGNIGMIMWNIVNDPIYENDEEISYLAAKIGVLVGQYDVAIKSIDEKVVGSVVWGSIGLFEVGEPEQALANLKAVVNGDVSDYIPLIESIVFLVYLKNLIGDTEDMKKYIDIFGKIVNSRQSRLIPEQTLQLIEFAEGIMNLHNKSTSIGFEQIEQFYLKSKNVGDQYWQLLALLMIGEQKLEYSDFVAAMDVYAKAKKLAINLTNEPLICASDIGLAHAYYLKGELKEANFIITNVIRRLHGKSQFYLGKAYFTKGKIAARMGQHTVARENLQKAENIARRYNDHNRVLIALLAIADDLYLVNEYDEAKKVYAQAYSQITNISNKKQFADALVQIVTSDFYQGTFDKILERVSLIETLSEEIVYQKGKADAIRLKAQYYIRQNQEIIKHIFALKASQILYLEVGDHVSSANCDILIAKAYISLGDTANAAKYLESAKSYYMKISDNLMIAEIKEIQAEFDIKDGKYDEALVRLRSSYSHFSDIFDVIGRYRCLRKIADTLALKGDFEESYARYKKVKNNVRNTKETNEKLIIALNSARNLVAKRDYKKAILEYKEAEKLLKTKKIAELESQLLKEKIHVYALMADKEQFNKTIEQMASENSQYIDDVDLVFFKSELSLESGEDRNQVYMSLISNVQQSLSNKKPLTSIGMLLNIISLIVDQDTENDTFNEIAKEELGSYINLLKALSEDNGLFFMQGIAYLLEIVFAYISNDAQKEFVMITESSTFFSEKGIETLANLLITIQYNFNKWKKAKTFPIDKLIQKPKIYNNAKELIKDIANLGVNTLYLNEIAETEKIVVLSSQ